MDIHSEVSYMNTRLELPEVQPAIKALLNVNDYADKTDLEMSLTDLVILRASQINQCAFCIDMHFKDAIASGESLQRLYGLDAWREMPIYSDRERAALAWTEALTILGEHSVSNDVYDELCQHFSTDEIVSLTMTIIGINSWNRLNIGLQYVVPGTYKSHRQPENAMDS
jgi:AhpD family alkylhydroperoxidase